MPLVPIFLLVVVKSLLAKYKLMPPMLVTSDTNKIGRLLDGVLDSILDRIP